MAANETNVIYALLAKARHRIAGGSVAPIKRMVEPVALNGAPVLDPQVNLNASVERAMRLVPDVRTGASQSTSGNDAQTRESPADDRPNVHLSEIGSSFARPAPMELGALAPSSPAATLEKLGDLLIGRQLITPRQLESALERQSVSGHLLGRILLEQGAVTAEQLAQALDAQHGGKPATADILARLGMPVHQIRATLHRQRTFRHPLTRIMRDWGYLSQEAVAKAIAIEAGLEYFPWAEIDNIAIESLRANGIGLSEFKGFVPVAFAQDGRRGSIAVLIPDRNRMNAASSEFRQHRCTFMVGSSETIQIIYRKYFAATAEVVAKLLDQHNQALANREDLSKSAIYQDLVMALLRHACYAGASDIQLFPSHDVGMIKLKVDGVWDIFQVVSLELLALLYGVVRNTMLNGVNDAKIAEGFTDCALDLNTDKDEQAQALRSRYADIIDRYVFRVELGNSVQGRTMTIRANDKESTAADLHQLGLDQKTLQRLKAYIRSKSGVFLLCGPTGSGKTTTLYALLRSVDAITESVQTVERPVEYTNGLWLQYPVSAMGEDEGKGWAEALKGILRNAPDKILFGETRDEGTARECFRAANTGHLVLSTLHSNGAAETVGRLTDLGIDREKLATQLLGVLAQRLVRKLCNSCKVPDERPETPQLLAGHTTKALRMSGRIAPFRARDGGCPNCGFTGYRGRRMVYELLHCSKKVKSLLEEGVPVSRLREGGLETSGTMLENAYRLVAEGVTSVDEIALHLDLEG